MKISLTYYFPFSMYIRFPLLKNVKATRLLVTENSFRIRVEPSGRD